MMLACFHFINFNNARFPLLFFLCLVYLCFYVSSFVLFVDFISSNGCVWITLSLQFVICLWRFLSVSVLLDFVQLLTLFFRFMVYILVISTVLLLCVSLFSFSCCFCFFFNSLKVVWKLCNDECVQESVRKEQSGFYFDFFLLKIKVDDID